MSSLTIRLNKPCRADEICEGPYSYRHFLSLTNNSAAFSVSEMKLCQTVLFEVHVSVPIKLVLCVHFNCQMAVNSRIISGNLDSPEGGIDGLLQAVVCQDVSHHAHTYTHTHMMPHTCTHAHTHTHTHTHMPTCIPCTCWCNPVLTDHWLEGKPC